MLYEELTRLVIGAAIEVHKVLGPGFLESVYESALAREMTERGIRFRKQDRLEVKYKGTSIGTFRTDILVEDKIVIEIKAVQRFAAAHTAQALNYLAATGIRLALLLNFGAPVLGIKRVIH
jgi:GxxExxY protein